MSLYFNYPWALLGLLGLIWLWYWHGRSVALATPWRRALSLGLRIAVVVCMVLALSDPRWLGTTGREHVVWLVDASRSTDGAALARAEELMAESSGADGPASQSVALFGRGAEALSGADEIEGAALSADAGDASDLAAALGFAEASFPAGHVKTVVLLSDGLETEGDAVSAAQKLAAAGTRVHTVLVEPERKPEVLVRQVDAPAQVAEDEPFRLTAEIFSTKEGEVEVDLFRNGTRVGTKTIEVREGLNQFETTQKVGREKLNEFRVAVRAPEGEDAFVDNNQAAAIVQSEGKSKALLISDQPEAARYLALALRQEGVLLDVRPAVGAPTQLSDLQNYDLVIFDNVPATALQPRQMDLIASYVRDFGGGFLMLGGDQAFGLGGYYQTAIEEILPVRSDFEKERETPSLGLVLVMDKSGSMSGLKVEMAKEAAKAAVELLGPQDYAGVVAFDGEAFWAAELGSARDKYAILQRISAIMAGGGTNIEPALELAYSQLSVLPAKLKHVILLTDGVSTPGRFYEVTTQMAQDRITVSTVALGADADQRLLEQIARWGNGRYYFTDNPQSVPQIFTRETMTAAKSALKELPFIPQAARPAPFLSGVNVNEAPFLLGHVITKAKPTAEQWLVTEAGEPLLSTWRFGLGQAGAWTSDARNRWAVEWLKWKDFGKFWAQVVRKLKRPSLLKDYPARMERARGGYRLVVDTVDERGGYLADVAGEAAVAGPDGQQQQVPLRVTAPGRLEGWFPATEQGAYHAQIQLKQSGQSLAQQYLSQTLGYPDELLLRPPDAELLAELARTTGGVFNPTADQITGEGEARTAENETELWPWLLALALLCFVGDVASRRLPERVPGPGGKAPAPKRAETVAG
ncbi:MAG: VWA domain-containing protein [Verrucomicrobiota bacterium]